MFMKGYTLKVSEAKPSSSREIPGELGRTLFSGLPAFPPGNGKIIRQTETKPSTPLWTWSGCLHRGQNRLYPRGHSSGQKGNGKQIHYTVNDFINSVIPSNIICNPIVATINPIIRINGFMKLYLIKKFPIRRACNIQNRFTTKAIKMAIIVISRPYWTGNVTAAVMVAGPAIIGMAIGTVVRSANLICSSTFRKKPFNKPDRPLYINTAPQVIWKEYNSTWNT